MSSVVGYRDRSLEVGWQTPCEKAAGQGAKVSGKHSPEIDAKLIFAHVRTHRPPHAWIRPKVGLSIRAQLASSTDASDCSCSQTRYLPIRGRLLSLCIRQKQSQCIRQEHSHTQEICAPSQLWSLDVRCRNGWYATTIARRLWQRILYHTVKP